MSAIPCQFPCHRISLNALHYSVAIRLVCLLKSFKLDMGAYLHILLNFSAEFLIKYYTVSFSYNLQIYFYYRVPKGNVVHTNIYLIQLQYFEVA